MVVMCRTHQPPLRGLDFFDRRRQIVNPAVEVIGRAEEDDGARDVLEADVVVSATSAESFILTADQIQKLQAQREPLGP